MMRAFHVKIRRCERGFWQGTPDISKQKQTDIASIRAHFRWSPIQNFQLNRAPSVEFIYLGRESQVEFPDGQRFVAAVPPDRLVRHRAVTDPEFDVLFLCAHPLQRF
jgi:hypothetical protein